MVWQRLRKGFAPRGLCGISGSDGLGLQTTDRCGVRAAVHQGGLRAKSSHDPCSTRTCDLPSNKTWAHCPSSSSALGGLRSGGRPSPTSPFCCSFPPLLPPGPWPMDSQVQEQPRPPGLWGGSRELCSSHKEDARESWAG